MQSAILLLALAVPGLHDSFQKPPDDARVMMRWWWFGPAVSKPRLDQEMRTMKAGGFGGFEVQPVYPVSLDDPSRAIRNEPFLSPGFLENLRYTAQKARELGLRFDLTLGSGWPYGGPSVPVQEASGRLRVQRVKPPAGARRIPIPDVGAGEQYIAAFDSGTQKELPGPKEGNVFLPAGVATPGEVLFFISSRTGMMVKRPGVGAEGFVLDHYSRTATEHYLQAVGRPLLQAVAPIKPHAIFCDSFEVFGSDWTPDFLAEFRQRRGYDLRPHLPALVLDGGPRTADIRYDWGRTLTELVEERFLTPMQAFAKANGTRFRAQDYGIPPATLGSNFFADLPEGEGTDWKEVRAARWAASASHLFGRTVTSSETWTWLHSPSFRATPLDMKAEADIHFLQGVNQLIGHGWPYNADAQGYPGTRFYAAAVFNDRNPWWLVMPEISAYLQRMSFLLRQGKPANDVALYLPNADAYASFTAGRVHMIEVLRAHLGKNVMPQILEAGYGLDFFDDTSLARAGSVDKGALVFDANRYRAIVLPNVEFIPIGTLRKLEAFVKGGGVLVATRRAPAAAPGFLTPLAEKDEAAAILQRLFSGPAKVVADEQQLGKSLAALLTPDMALGAPASEIGFVHRRTAAEEIYFIANTGNRRQNITATFRVAGLTPKLWDAMMGSASPAVPVARDASTVTLNLDMEPYGSRVVVFSKKAAAPPAVAKVASRQVIDISAGWQFQLGPMPTLHSWTDDEATRFYSGVADYQRDVTVPAGLLSTGAPVMLDFGEGKALDEKPGRNGMRAMYDPPIREAAVVIVNGQRAGALWCPPYRLDVTKYLKAGSNHIVIKVANTAINHMAGRALPDYRLLNLRYGTRFEPQDMEQVKPVPSGILGTIQLVSGEAQSTAAVQDYPVQPVPFTAVHLNDVFWAPRIEINRKVTIPFAFQQCEETGRVDNFERAAKALRGEPFANKEPPGYPFDDTDIYKVIEGASYVLTVTPDPKLDSYIDTLIVKIAAAQERDGYLYTTRTIDPAHPHAWAGKNRWEKEEELSHELYNLGHLYEAAVAHYQATGKRTLLNIAIRTADLLDQTFGPGKKAIWPGHQITEMGLAKLYRATGDARYLKLAQFLLDVRVGGKPYNQAHQHVVDQAEAVGHAVRATYMYSGMADVAALANDQAYVKAIDRIWDNVAGRKIYITGGIGSTSAGEAFGPDYDLPNMTAYNETCAAIGNDYWNHRLFLLHADSKYIDVMERTLYNGVISGVALDGKSFFYPNPLESNGQHARSPWFGCACCPSNVTRFLASIPGYVYAKKDSSIYVNLYAAGKADIELADKRRITLIQQTEYPWKGAVRLTVQPQRASSFAIHLRIPGWARNEAAPTDLYRFADTVTAQATVKVNGVPAPMDLDKGYVVLNREWKSGDTIELDLPMPIRRVLANDKVAADRGRVALQRGPLVYTAEWPDNPNGKVRNLLLPREAKLSAEQRPMLLNGVTVLTGQAQSLAYDAQGRVTKTAQPFTAIPYYAWANRGKGQMLVWLPELESAAKPLAFPTVATTAKITSSGKKDLEPLRDGETELFFDWWPSKGKTEWIEYTFAKPERLSETQVYWFDDTGHGECRVPAAWRILYNDGGVWKPVKAAQGFAVEKDSMTRVAFAPVTTTAIRIEVTSQPNWSSGLREWQVK
ncbi:MAG TPA: beta-L-arabinofuranosidase domain-containing protein [Paludibaculum sp.]